MTTRDIIEALGGTSAVSALTGVKPNAIRMWSKNGIPYRVWPGLLDEAQRAGVTSVTRQSLEATRPERSAA